jgi:ABC-type multidrug transport system fused ATPase/permease subunit
MPSIRQDKDEESVWSKQWFSVASVLFVIASLVAGYFYRDGNMQQTIRTMQLNLEELRTHVHSLDKTGCEPTRAIKWSVDLHDKDITMLKTEQRRLGDDLNQIKSDVRLIAEWVRQQQNDKLKP